MPVGRRLTGRRGLTLAVSLCRVVVMPSLVAMTFSPCLLRFDWSRYCLWACLPVQYWSWAYRSLSLVSFCLWTWVSILLLRSYIHWLSAFMSVPGAIPLFQRRLPLPSSSPCIPCCMLHCLIIFLLRPGLQVCRLVGFLLHSAGS